MATNDAAVVSRKNNSLLSQISDAEWERIGPHIQTLQVGTGHVLYGRQDKLDFVYFPRRGCISMVIDFTDGVQAGAGLVGAEGMVGVPLIYRIRTDAASAVVQAPSDVLRIPAPVFVRELEHMPQFARHLCRYGEGVRAEAMQLAACNGHHGLDVRLARCILTLQDRYRSSEVPVTHEMLASLLSVHRPSLSVAAKRLQHAGFIRYAAGHLVVVDRAGLEGASCECYQVIRDHLQVVLDPP